MKLFFVQWRSELHKLLARKRTFLGFGAFVLLEIVMYILVTVEGQGWFRRVIQNEGEVFEKYFSGLTLGYLVLRLSIFLLGAIYLSLVAGDVVAKESEDGNLRLILARPISRLRLLTLKYASCILYTVVLIQFIAWTALLLGIILRGWGGGLFAFAPEQQFIAFYDATEGLKRYAMSTVSVSLSMMIVTSIAFFLSCCWRIKPAAATIVAISYLFIDMILREGHFVENHRGLLITEHTAAWSMVFFEEIPWAVMFQHYAKLAGVSLTLFVLAAVVFESRDVKS
jgi:ABC-2 type transport system permease protein